MTEYPTPERKRLGKGSSTVKAHSATTVVGLDTNTSVGRQLHPRMY